MQVAIRSNDVLLLAGDSWGDDGSAVVIGNSCIADGDGSQETHKLRNKFNYSAKLKLGSLRNEFRRAWLNEFQINIAPEKENKATFDGARFQQQQRNSTIHLLGTFLLRVDK